MASFADLKFETRYEVFGPDDVQARHSFPNGYGVSVVRGRGTYGSEDGLYELAVTHPGIGLVYDTPITDDVLGRLTEADVSEAMAEVEALPPRTASSSEQAA